MKHCESYGKDGHIGAGGNDGKDKHKMLDWFDPTNYTLPGSAVYTKRAKQ